MEPNMKLMLDEIKKLGDRFTSLESRVDTLGNRLTPIEDKAVEVLTWQQEVEASITGIVAKVVVVDQLAGKDDTVDALKSQISNINAKLDRVVLDRGGSVPGILPKPEMAAVTPPAGNPAIGPDGHRSNNHLRENGYGSVMAYTNLSVKGTSSYPLSSLGRDGCPYASHRFQGATSNSMCVSSGQWPKLPFPEFDGKNPKLWQSRYENYFDMCGVYMFNWVRISSMYFDGPAAR
jgi:hypothetical protein